HHVIVGTGAQTFDARLFPRTSRKEDDRSAAQVRMTPHCLEDGKTIEYRHHHVSQHKVRMHLLDGFDRLSTVTDCLDSIVGCEHACHIIAHVSVIVSDENESLFVLRL